MTKLFVAVDLPDSAKAELVRLQPTPMTGIRLPAASQIHLTVHYLGEANLDRTATKLQSVDVPAFSLDFLGVGQFPSQDGAVTLWTGVGPDPGLLALHRAVAQALEGEGFKPEARPYSPHVTLARLGPGMDSRIVRDVLSAHAGFALRGVDVTEFALYSTMFVDGAPVYRREHAFKLM